jgi:hypothetical protein
MRGAVDLVRFTQSLSSAASLEQLERAFLAGFGTVVGAQVYGYDLYDRATGAVVWSTRASAGDAGTEPVVEVPLLIAGAAAGRLYCAGREHREHRELVEALAAVIADRVEGREGGRALERARDHGLTAL